MSLLSGPSDVLFGRRVVAVEHLELPLRRVAFLRDEAENIRPSFMPSFTQALVAGRRYVKALSPDLQETYWRTPAPEISAGLCLHPLGVVYGPIRVGDPDRNEMWILDPDNGSVRARLAAPGSILVAVSGDIILLYRSTLGLVGLDLTSGEIRWQHPQAYARGTWHEAADGVTFFVRQDRERALHALNAMTGETRWALRLDGDSEQERLMVGFPDVVVRGESLIVVTRTRTIRRLDAKTGTIQAETRMPFHQAHTILSDALIVVEPGRVATLNLDSFSWSVSTWRCPPDVGRLRSLWGSAESLFATTESGHIIGCSRPGAQAADTWSHQFVGALMPIGEAPIACGRYLYIAPPVSSTHAPIGIYAFESAR